MRTGQISALLVRASINSEVEKVGPNTAVVQQRIALCGSPVTDDALSFVLGVHQKFQQSPLRTLHLLIESSVDLDLVEAGAPLFVLELLNSCLHWLGDVFRVPPEYAERPAVGRQFPDIK